MTRSVAVVAGSIAVAVALVLGYAALGGGRYAPTPSADPCTPRPPARAGGFDGALEQIALSTADGAACDLGVTREELVLALGSEDDLDRFAQKHDISHDEAEDAVRAGLVRAIADAERRDEIGGGTATVLREVATRLPIGLLLAVLRGTSKLPFF